MKGLTILGNGAGSGKSCYSVGVLRLWRDLGWKVEPFKAVTVVDLQDPSCDHPDLWRHGVYHHCSAAGVDWEWTHNPVAVVPHSDALSGELFIKGQSRGVVALTGSDCVDFQSMSPHMFSECEIAILEGLEILQSRGSRIVIEGAGAVDQHKEDSDLANRTPALIAGLPIVLVSGLQGLDLIPEYACRLDPQLSQLIRAFMVNGVIDEESTAVTVAELSRRVGNRFVGWTPRVVYPPYDGTFTARQQRYRIWADAISRAFRGSLEEFQRDHEDDTDQRGPRPEISRLHSLE
ncbi:hypothetical protein ACWY4P_52405 [Streptomyces sp. LZ34]